MKILFVVEHFYPYVGGAEELFLNLTTSLAGHGHDITVVTTLHNDSLQKSEVYKGVKISRVRCYNRFLFTIMGLPEILRRAKNADCIHTTSYNSAVPAFIAGFFLRKKVIITFHEVWGKLWFRLPYTSQFLLSCYYFYEKFILKLPFDRYIAVSDYTRKSLIESGISENKISRIYNGIDYDSLKPFQFHPPQKFTICFFGRLGISKGIELLIEAAGAFISKYPDASFKLIIPTYPEKLFEKIITSIRKLKLENNILLLHNLTREQLLSEVSGSSCVIIPSYSEGFCFVAAESIGMGVPVISSGKGALSEVVSGKHIIIESLNADGIFNALEKAIQNKWNENPTVYFPLKKSIEDYLRLYQDLHL